MKSYPQKEADTGMELVGLRKWFPLVTYETIKIRSHINREDASNERYWKMNEWVDQLETEARNKVTQGGMQACRGSSSDTTANKINPYYLIG